MKKKILITGGCGYIGSHCVRFFKNNGFDVVIFDNFSTGHKEFSCDETKCIEGNLLNIDSLRKVFKKYKFDGVIHFAAFSLVGESVKNPIKYYENNIYGTLNLLKVMNEFGVLNLVFSSTAAVYGEPKVVPITETSEKNPTNPYGRTKFVIEKMFEDFRVAYGLNYVCLRYFNACGAFYDVGEWHEPESHLIPLILKTALGKRDKVMIFGDNYKTSDGTCIRDYVHVWDLANAHFLALNYLFNNGKSDCFNLGSGSGFSVREIVNKCKEVTEVNFNVEMGCRREGDPAVLIADSSKALKVLKWKPKFGLDEIVESAWKWHKERE